VKPTLTGRFLVFWCAPGNQRFMFFAVSAAVGGVFDIVITMVEYAPIGFLPW